MKIFYRLLIMAVFVTILIGVIAYARGYRLDVNKKSVTPTGIIAVNSAPQAAKVYLNGQFKGATSANLTLPPGSYKIEIKKEGYTSFTKTVTLKGELVLSVDALLFPINASLSPLTNIGVIKAVPVDQIDRAILFSQEGIYLFETSKKPLSFLPPLTTLVSSKNLAPNLDFEKSTIFFSYDYKQAIFEFELPNRQPLDYLVSLDEQNQQPFDITTSKETLITAWDEEKKLETAKILETFPKEIRKIASDSFQIISPSPDELKVLYKARQNAILPLVIDPPLIASNQTKEERNLKKDQFYVYDKKEDKNFAIKISNFKFQISNQVQNPKTKILIPPIPDSIFWYPDSKHFVIKEANQVSVIDYDGTNKQAVYSGPFETHFLDVSSDGRLLILANLNPQNNKLPDLYSIGIR